MTTLVSTDPLSPDITLEGQVVRLAPLALGHVTGLLQAASISRDSYQWTAVPATGAAMRDYVEAALRLAAQRQAVPFATTVRDSGRIVGTTRLATFEFHQWSEGSPFAPAPGLPDVVEIGWTWLAADVQRTAVNTEAKLLMLRHAFESWGVKAVRLKTDRRNERSWNAILRLGAKFDGIIRAHSPGADGLMRDSAYFSILADEWPWVRSGLEARLAR